MTNREWLNTLDNTHFVYFIYMWQTRIAQTEFESWLNKEYSKDDVRIKLYNDYQEIEASIKELRGE